LRILHVGGIVYEARDVDAMILGKMLEQGMRPYLVALIGRIRDAVTQKQNIQGRLSGGQDDNIG
jgi:hypothetical protein